MESFVVRPQRQSLQPDERTRARKAARPLAERLSLSERVAPYQSLAPGAEPWQGPTLYLEDISQIPFVQDVPGIEAYQHRARVRASDGDLFAAVTPPTPGYEAYCQQTLGLGRPHFVLAPVRGDLLAVAAACAQGEAFDRLAEHAAAHGGLAIHPYMSIEDVWGLGRHIAATAQVPVQVIGPPPPVLWVANDKRLLSEVVSLTLSDDWLVETLIATAAKPLSDALLGLASRYARVGLKRTRCASAMGNEVFTSAALLSNGQAATLERVHHFLSRTRWPQGEEVLAVAWEETDLSPSTQLWIPPDGAGAPVVEGIYEQLLEGPEKVFLGSRPSTLPDALNDRLAWASLMVAEAFQSFGYVGRCSFDFIVVGEPDDAPRVLFTECNGRWGGTSTPMHLVDRLHPAGPRPAYVAQDVMHPSLIGRPFDDVLKAVGDELFRPDTGQGRFIFYNVGPLEKKGKLDVIALGDNPEDALYGLRERLPDLLF